MNSLDSLIGINTMRIEIPDAYIPITNVKDKKKEIFPSNGLILCLWLNFPNSNVL